MAAATKEKMQTASSVDEKQNSAVAKREQNLPVIAAPRIPFHPAIEERFGVDKSQWKALVEAVFPLATSIDSVILALSYCRARNLDPFKRNVHIVPIWNKDIKRMVDTVWPGIGELRTTAFRTRCYAGRSECVFGPDIDEQVGNERMTYPEWAQITVRRLVGENVVDFSGPRVYWKETYAQARRDDLSPNSMWLKRPRGQLEKCAEAAALRVAFPEELGNEACVDEIGSTQFIDASRAKIAAIPSDDGRSASDKIADLLDGTATQDAEIEPTSEEEPTREPGDETEAETEPAPPQKKTSGKGQQSLMSSDDLIDQCEAVKTFPDIARMRTRVTETAMAEGDRKRLVLILDKHERRLQAEEA